MCPILEFRWFWRGRFIFAIWLSLDTESRVPSHAYYEDERPTNELTVGFVLRWIHASFTWHADGDDILIPGR